MSNVKNIDINKQIIIEKGNFLLRNNTFFYNNLKDKDEELKQILLNPAPLKQCPEYNELIEEIHNSKVRNNTQYNYQYTLETLFHIVNKLRSNHSIEKIEQIRAYVKYISSQFSESKRTIYDSKKIVLIDEKQVQKVKKIMKR